jgi:hypothetical protein
VREISIYAVIIIILIVMLRYIWLLIKKEIKPALAMWLFFSVAIIMSFITYMSDANYGYLDNIMNSVDLIYVVTISVAILLFGDKSSKFTRFDTGCLVAVLVIVVFWIFTRNHKLTNILMQAVLVIAYFPVVKRLIDSKENTEPFSVWIGMLLAPSLALISSRGILAKIYSVRAIICISILLLLMLRVEIINKRRKQQNLQV